MEAKIQDDVSNTGVVCMAYDIVEYRDFLPMLREVFLLGNRVFDFVSGCNYFCGMEIMQVHHFKNRNTTQLA